MKLDRISSVVLFLIGSVMVAEGFRLPYTIGTGPGPGLFPVWLGTALMFLASLLFLTTRRPNKPFIESRDGFMKAALVGGAFLVYILALSYLGLLLSLALFLAFLVGGVEKKGRKAWVAAAVLGSLSCYLVFEAWLGVPLPIGVLGI